MEILMYAVLPYLIWVPVGFGATCVHCTISKGLLIISYNG